MSTKMLSISSIIVVLVCLCLLESSRAAFSVGYFAHSAHPQVVNAGFVSAKPVSTVQVADIYNRLSGLSPLLLEGWLFMIMSLHIYYLTIFSLIVGRITEKENLPSIDTLSMAKVQPIILEIHANGNSFRWPSFCSNYHYSISVLY